jgi:hypothetical protein
MQKVHVARVVMMAAMTLAWTTGALARAVDTDAGPESKRLARAKDLIADEQWPRAIDELRAAVADAKEPRRDEALYWLAHSLNQSGDQGSAVETIARLETDFPSSMWVKPARSLRVEIAVRLNRVDVLWRMVQPPAQPAMPVKVPAPVKAPPPVSPRVPKSEKPTAPAKMWYTDEVPPDADLQVQALGALLKTDGERVVPMLKQIAFESEHPGPAMRAVFMLAQSSLPEARATVVKIAESGPEPVRVAAVRDLGRFGGPEAPKELLSLYPTAIEPVKYQIVKVLGERSDMLALMRIVESEKDGTLRYSAIAGLGQAGGGAQLARMYKSASLKGKRPIIIGLFSARADGELIRIAETEQDAALRQEALERLRLLGTPKAKEYLQKVSEKR